MKICWKNFRNLVKADRYWASGGMFNLFKNIPFANCIFRKIITLIDECTSLNI